MAGRGCRASERNCSEYHSMCFMKHSHTYTLLLFSFFHSLSLSLSLLVCVIYVLIYPQWRHWTCTVGGEIQRESGRQNIWPHSNSQGGWFSIACYVTQRDAHILADKDSPFSLLTLFSLSLYLPLSLSLSLSLGIQRSLSLCTKCVSWHRHYRGWPLRIPLSIRPPYSVAR